MHSCQFTYESYSLYFIKTNFYIYQSSSLYLIKVRLYILSNHTLYDKVIKLKMLPIIINKFNNSFEQKAK